MDKLKVNKIVDIFFDYLNENNNYSVRYKEILNTLMERIITYYESIGITEIYDEQEYLFKSPDCKYSVEDFFINRLLYNVVYLEIKNQGGRACWADSFRSITLNRNKISNLLNTNNTNFTEKENYMAGIKVVMHEFEHALQTSYDIGIDFVYIQRQKELYNRLKANGFTTNLNEMYDGRKIDFNRINSLQSGLKKSSDIYKIYKGTFWLTPNDKNYFNEDNLNEIFNESESLIMSGSNQNRYYNTHSGNRFLVMNNESSNYAITNYGFLLKILFGKKLTFKGMYFDRDVLVDYFNQEYGEIFYKIFKDHLNKHYPNIKIKDAWSILNMIISEIKESVAYKEYNEQCHLKLNLALSLCLDKKIKNDLNNGKQFEECKQEWIDFTKYVMYNPVMEKHKKLPHIEVLIKLQEYIKDFKNVVNQHISNELIEQSLEKDDESTKKQL